MPLSAFLSDIPKPFLLVAMVLGFVWFWPVGLAVLFFLIGSGRIGRGHCGPGRWYNAPPGGYQSANGGGGGQPGGRPGGWGGGWGGFGGGWGRWCQPNAAPPPSSNRAFDEYRAETLRRLEEEQKEFVEYLERLRQARDKAEFDQFMADRRSPGTPRAPEGPTGN